MPNFKLTLCYDGAHYDGWQKQGNTKHTLQEKLEQALSALIGQPVEAAASGRTDSGVHAMKQVVSFHADTKMPTEVLLARLRAALPGDIGAMSLEIAPPRFHARLSCTGKTYVYIIWNSKIPCVFERRYVHVVPAQLDIEAMNKAADILCGTHDFAAFCSAKRMKHSSVRTVRSIDIEPVGNELRLTFTGDGFLYNMVRIMVGTLLEVGGGLREAESLTGVLDSLDRRNAGPTAPPNALFLWDVYYDKD